MRLLFGLCLGFFLALYSMGGLAYGPWRPGIPSPYTAPQIRPAMFNFQVYSFWDQAGDYRVRIAHQGLKPGDIRLRLIPGSLVVDIQQAQDRRSPFGHMQQSSSMRQMVSLPHGVDLRRVTVVETNSGIEVRIPAWRYR